MSIRARLSFLTQVLLLGSFTYGQVTVTQPAANVSFHAAEDYATRTFQDPWDMQQWTDLGWYTFGIDQPLSNLANVSFAGGFFSATSTSSNPNFWLLDTYTPGSAPLGKIGSLFPIDSTKYRRLLIRMNLSGSGFNNPPTSAQQTGQVLWSNNSISQPGGMSTSNSFFTYPGWWIYSYDLPTWGLAAGPAAWSSKPVDSLRINAVNLPAPIGINVGWAKLVADDPTLYGNVAWTGAGAVDIYLDNDTNFSNGYVGQIATNAQGGSFQFYVGGLPKGTYYVAVRPYLSSNTPAYSAGAWSVDDIPTLTFTSPSPEGSSDDFATTQLSNAWDMNALTDIDASLNVSGLSITQINAQDEAGNPLGSTRVLAGTSAGNFGDIQIYPLRWDKRGATNKIDTSRYRILSLKWGLAGRSRDINAGSIGRLVWKVSGEAVENVSDDIILKHLPNSNVIQNVIADMKTLQLETDPGGSPSLTGWNGLVDGFRVKPGEFPSATNLYIQSIKLSAFERANASYTIQWTYANLGPTAPTLQLYWDGTGTGFAGTLIASGLNPASGSYVWNTSALVDGTYYIYARLMNGSTVLNQSYSRWPIVVSHIASGGTVSLDGTDVWFGATQNGATVTASQKIQVTATGGLGWTVSSDQSYIVVSPSSGSGNGSFNVSVNSSSLPTGNSSGVITLTAAGASNSPRIVHWHLNVMNAGSTAAPFGSFDTPANNSTGLTGSVGVTGWVLDDVEVTKVQIWRDPLSGEPVAGNGLVYIGDATFVRGARPDVESLYSTFPLSDRAGWGYLMLTNMLPNSGNGTYKIHAIAIDKDGHTVELGTKVISCNNAQAAKPFGAIDTPGPGNTVSGTIINFGWALTQQPYSIPADGSTIVVMMDGQILGHPVYNQYRSDIANLFPGYANSNGAVGYFYIDTTQFSNGLHNLSWVVTDNAGRTDGIGSRYITIFN